jgi:hypothetical protein
MAYRDTESRYIPKNEIDDVEDDEMDTDYIDPRRSPQKLRMMAMNQQKTSRNNKLRAFGKMKQANHASKKRIMSGQKPE